MKKLKNLVLFVALIFGIWLTGDGQRTLSVLQAFIGLVIMSTVGLIYVNE